MQRTLLIVILAMLAACATQETAERRLEEDQAIRDFIEVSGIAEVDKVRADGNDGWKTLSERFIIFANRRERFLFEFARRCHELNDNTRITPDVRSDPNVIRAKFDTLRGCRIHKIYALSAEQADELRQIGEAPGSRNQDDN